MAGLVCLVVMATGFLVVVSWQQQSLLNIDYGDRAGPDSRGVFQQRSNLRLFVGGQAA